MAVQPFKSSIAHYNLLNAVFAQLFVLFLIIHLGSIVSNLYMKQLTYFFYVLCSITISAGLFYGFFSCILTDHQKEENLLWDIYPQNEASEMDTKICQNQEY